jgi:hypothetical protein
MDTMEHIRYLSEEIGPRGSTTPKEAQAAQYAAQTLQKLGFNPVIETFSSARSNWYPYALFSGLMMVSSLLFMFGDRWGTIAALILSSLSLLSVLLELSFRPNPLRWILPTGDSQNAWAKIPSRENPNKKVVLIGHLDTHRTPLAFSTDTWLKVFGGLVPLGLVSSILLILLLIIGLFDPGSLWRYLSIPFFVIFLAFFALTFQADLTPYAPGANDNASGAGIVLHLAERLKMEPLSQTTVWAVLNGCEEVGCYGAEAFAHAHQDELHDAIWIAIDSVGARDTAPHYLTHETFFLTTRSDPELLALADRISTDFPELDAHPFHFKGAFTDGAIGGKYGFRVLSLLSLRTDGGLPQWHRPTDVIENVDPDVVQKNETFLWELLHEIDTRV